MFVIESAEDARAAVGKEIGTSDWITVDQHRIDLFAEATEDRQWIHVDVERSAGGPYGTTIAHGYLTLSLVPDLMRQVFAVQGAAMGVNYGVDTVRFLTPVPSGSRVRVRVSVRSAEVREDDGLRLGIEAVVELEGAPRPACVATTIALYRFAKNDSSPNPEDKA
ncbi:MaoC family dehydratase [Streptomyces sp. NPDC090075]|uniref:MaoC family dehydratase n=1 Tax=Streptomyces sp. NPDC090075 TaxID=3365937 RepID=UPI0037FEA571